MAIIATGIDVLDLQENGLYSEYQAMYAIHSFLKKWEGPRSGLSGYNTESFDIPYLRTSFVRNGFYPYLKFKSCDLMILAQKVFGTSELLRQEYFGFLSELKKEEKPRFSLKLENIASFFSLLDRPQSHESEDDVEVTLKLAKLFAEKHNESLFTFEPFDLFAFQKPTGEPISVQTVARTFEDPLRTEFFVFLRTEGASSYWTSLESFQKWSQKKDNGPLPIKRFKHCEALRWHGELLPSQEDITLAQNAFKELKGFKTDELYPPKDVYVEQWIYKLSPQQMSALSNLIHKEENEFDISNPLKGDIAILFKRFLIASSDDELLRTEFRESFQRYCQYRYGGQMILYTENDRDKPKDRPHTHLTYHELIQEIQRAHDAIKNDSARPMKEHALEALQQFYTASPIASMPFAQ